MKPEIRRQKMRFGGVARRGVRERPQPRCGWDVVCAMTRGRLLFLLDLLAELEPARGFMGRSMVLCLPWNPKMEKTFNIQHSTFNIQHSTFNIQQSTFNNQQSTSNVQGPSIRALVEG